MIEGLTLSSGEQYSAVFSEPILQTEDVSYYACRSPDDATRLVALSMGLDVSEQLAVLEERRGVFMKEMDLAALSTCPFGECKGIRGCHWVNYLPRVLVNDFKKSGAVVLDYCCLDFQKAILLKNLVSNYYAGTLTIYRLAVSFFTLVDWLLRLGIEVEISPQNLLVNLETSFITLIDWSKAKVKPFISTSQTIKYYQAAAQILMDLSGAKRHEGKWKCPFPVKNLPLLRIFDLLQQIIEFQLESQICTSDQEFYLLNLQEQRRYLIPKINEIVYHVKSMENQPLYEITSRNKEG